MDSFSLSRFSLPQSLRRRRHAGAAAGRNKDGRITVRHRGGGHKRAIRILDWNRTAGSGVIIGFTYDPRRNARLAKVIHPTNPASYSLLLAAKGRQPFQSVTVHEPFSTNGLNQTVSTLLRPGDSAPLSSFEAGDLLHAVQPFPGHRPLFARAAGTFCQVRAIEHSPSKTFGASNSGTAIIRLPSGAQRRISLSARATVGRVSSDAQNSQNQSAVRGKAGRSRWLGRRPTVRGVARNPVDHPHGGNSFGRPSVTFKGWPTKGQPTRRSKRTNSHILPSPTKR